MAAHPTSHSPDSTTAATPVGVPWAVIFGVWAVFWLVFTAIRVLFTRWLAPAVRFPSPVYGALNDALQLGQWALLTPAIFWLSGRLTLTRRNWPTRLPMHLVIGLVLVVVTSLVMLLGQYLFLPTAMRFPLTAYVITQKLLDYGTPLFLLLYAGLLGTGFALHYYRDLQRQQLAAARMSTQLAEARLAALRMQLHPHFLFNTLNTIAALTERDPPAARRSIARLGELLRRTLDSAREQEVALADELRFVEGYLELAMARFGDRLEVAFQVDGEVCDALLPTLILQPLVENAVEHGVAPVPGPGYVTVDATRDGEALLVRIRNSVQDVDSARAGGGIGLENTRARLVQLYGDAASLTLERRASEVVVDLRLPYHTRRDLRAALVAEGR